MQAGYFFFSVGVSSYSIVYTLYQKSTDNMFIAIILIFAMCSPFYRRKIAGSSVRSVVLTTEKFNALEVALPADIFYASAAGHKVEIMGEPDQLAKIETYVHCSKLHIRSMRYRAFRSQPRISVFVSAPDLISLGVDSKGSIHTCERNSGMMNK